MVKVMASGLWGAKSLPEPILIYWQSNPQEHTWTINQNKNIFLWRICISKWWPFSSGFSVTKACPQQVSEWQMQRCKHALFHDFLAAVMSSFPRVIQVAVSHVPWPVLIAESYNSQTYKDQFCVIVCQLIHHTSLKNTFVKLLLYHTGDNELMWVVGKIWKLQNHIKQWGTNHVHNSFGIYCSP